MATCSSILAWRIPMDRGDWWATVHGVTGHSQESKHSTQHTSFNRNAQHWSLPPYIYPYKCKKITCHFSTASLFHDIPLFHLHMFPMPLHKILSLLSPNYLPYRKDWWFINKWSHRKFKSSFLPNKSNLQSWNGFPLCKWKSPPFSSFSYSIWCHQFLQFHFSLVASMSNTLSFLFWRIFLPFSFSHLHFSFH